MNGKPKSKYTPILTLLIGLLMMLPLLLVTPQSGTAKQEQNHKLIARKELLEESGGDIILWHDYGSFALYLITHQTWQQLPENVRAQVQLIDDSDHLFVGDKGVDTQLAAIRQKEVGEAIKGKSLYLVQFVGPIKEEWLTVVEATGADLVHYVANYGYLVWTDASSRQQLDMMAERGSFVQLAMPYLSPFKLGPTLSIDQIAEDNGDELINVTIQLYSHDQINESELILEELLLERSGPWEFVLNFQNITGVIRRSDIALVAGLPDAVWVGEHFPRELNDEVQGQIMANNLAPNQTVPSGPGYFSWLAGIGLSSDPNSYPIVDITDDGIGNGVAAAAGGDVTLRESGDAAKPSRLAYIANCTSEPDGAGRDGHGHLNVSIAGGYDKRSGFPYRDDNGYQLGLGINPFGRFAGTRVFDDAFNTEGCGGTDQSLIRATFNRGARIVSNSWGCSLCAGIYDTASQAYDAGVRDADPSTEGNQELTILFSAGNSGPDLDTIGTPGNGKNMITVGASENVRPTWTDGCGVAPAGADSVPDIASFSSRGPAPGGRTKPDVVAPGTHVQGTASTAPNYNGFGVCDPFHPDEPEIFAASSGTSHSAPAVAGYASLVYGLLQQKYELPAPSPALIKAFIVAHTMYLDGSGSEGNLPNHNQGFGLPDMNAALVDTPRVVFDQTDTKLFDSSGETWTQTISAVDTTKPVQVVMAFTDQPGAVGREPQVNDLNLAVRADGMTYLGNHMENQWSVTGGTPDRVNTVEAVFLPSISDRSIAVEVTAFNIAGDGVPGVGDSTDQDFVIVCSNCIQREDFTLSAQPDQNSLCRSGNAEYVLHLESILGFSDPVTLNTLDLPAGVSSQFSKNPVTPTDTSKLMLSATNQAAVGSYSIDITGESADRFHSTTVKLGISSEEPATPELLLPPDGTGDLLLQVTLSWSAVAQAATYDVQIASDPNFEQIVEEASGLTQTTYTTKELQAGQIYYWRVRAVSGCGNGDYSAVSMFGTKPLPGGCPFGVTPEEIYFTNFEGSTADWTHEGIRDTWQLTSERAHSASKSFHAFYPKDENQVDQVSDQILISPAIKLPPRIGPLTFQFWNYQSMEEIKPSCYDGGILEISENDGQTWMQLGGPPQDDSVLITDPYDGIISSDYSNPISGKAAWCGDPQEWVNSVVKIDEFAGQTVRFRFRLGSDISIGKEFGHEGWYIDDVLVQVCPTLVIDSFMPAVYSP